MQLVDYRAPPVLSVEACDPRGLIRGALTGAAGRSPRDLYLAWLLELPIEIDAAHAAALLLKRVPRPAATDRPAQALLTLLRTTMAYPRERLEPVAVARQELH